MDKELLRLEYKRLLDELAPAPGSARAMWYYVLVLLMIEDEKAEIVRSNQDGNLVHLVVQTPDGAMFDVVRPPMSQEMLDSFLGHARELVP